MERASPPSLCSAQLSHTSSRTHATHRRRRGIQLHRQSDSLAQKHTHTPSVCVREREKAKRNCCRMTVSAETQVLFSRQNQMKRPKPRASGAATHTHARTVALIQTRVELSLGTAAESLTKLKGADCIFPHTVCITTHAKCASFFSFLFFFGPKRKRARMPRSTDTKSDFRN